MFLQQSAEVSAYKQDTGRRERYKKGEKMNISYDRNRIQEVQLGTIKLYVYKLSLLCRRNFSETATLSKRTAVTNTNPAASEIVLYAKCRDAAVPVFLDSALRALTYFTLNTSRFTAYSVLIKDFDYTEEADRQYYDIRLSLITPTQIRKRQ
jgi:hypothetical protein